MKRRDFLYGVTGGLGAVAFHSMIRAEEANQGPLEPKAPHLPNARAKRCIMLYMEGGVSQIDTFDMKPGRPTAGPFRPIVTNVDGIQVCEYLPKMAQHADKLAIIRSMKTKSVDHGIGGYHMHTCYPQSERVPHPEIGAMIAKYCENPESDLPSFVKMGASGNYGAGYLGPKYDPFVLGTDGRKRHRRRLLRGCDRSRAVLQ